MHWIRSEIGSKILIAVVAALISSAGTTVVWSFTFNHRLSTIETDIREVRVMLVDHLNTGGEQ